LSCASSAPARSAAARWRRPIALSRGPRRRGSGWPLRGRTNIAAASSPCASPARPRWPASSSPAVSCAATAAACASRRISKHRRGNRSLHGRAGEARPEGRRMNEMNARSLLALLFHADKALDLVQTASDLGLLARLDAGPVSLGALAAAVRARPLRLYKFLDGLESLGLVERRQASDDLLAAEYVSTEPLAPAVEAVLGERSIERDRNRYAWRGVHGRLGEVLAGELDASFAWPPVTDEDVRGFESSMAAGCGPIGESMMAARDEIFDSRTRWLDVGGGDG